ncbi:hypothetical protein ES707_01424 [subsurface metagenome]
MWVKLDTKTITVSPSEYWTVAEAGSFEELEGIMPDLDVPKGGRIRIIMELNQPVAPAFDLAGAEWLFGGIMPEGLDLIDIHGEGWTTVVIEGEADPVRLAAIPAFLVAHWLGLSLAAIGITATLGFLLLAIKVDINKAIEAAPSVTKWLAIGAIGAAAIGLLAVVSKKRG